MGEVPLPLSFCKPCRSPSLSGRFDLRLIGLELGLALQQRGRPSARPLADQLLLADLDERLRPRLVQQLLQQEPVLLVLDDFEQSLSVGGEIFPDPDTASGRRGPGVPGGVGAFQPGGGHRHPGGGSAGRPPEWAQRLCWHCRC